MKNNKVTDYAKGGQTTHVSNLSSFSILNILRNNGRSSFMFAYYGSDTIKVS